MKSTSIIALFIAIFFLSAFRISDPAPNVLDIKLIEKSIAKINDTLYASKYEVSNMLYLAFEKSLQEANKTELLNVSQVDTANWPLSFTQNEPFLEFYYRNPAYKEFPVVNISWEAANLFCQWLTDEYNAAPKKMFKKVLFRLPTESEWELAARGGTTGIPYPWGYKLSNNGRNMCNYKMLGEEYIKYDSVGKKYFLEYNPANEKKIPPSAVEFITAPVISYEANDLGLYNVCGNVAEMTSIKGVSCGGGWQSTGGDVSVTSRAFYKGSSNYLGFRFFMVVIEK
jgi:sulfatase modifying factor 1